MRVAINLDKTRDIAILFLSKRKDDKKVSKRC